MGIPDKLKVKPSMEFEGPLGKFWQTEEVPTECLFEAIEELITELKRREGRRLRCHLQKDGM